MIKQLLLLLVCSTALAGQGMYPIPMVYQAPAPSGDSCTGGLVFSAHFETNEDIDTAVGCVDGSYYNDTVATVTGSPTVVTGADGYLSTTASGDYISFDIATWHTNGSALIKFRTAAYSSGTFLIQWFGDVQNLVELRFDSSNDVRFRHVGGDYQVQGLLLDAPLNPQTDDYWIVIRWDGTLGVEAHVYTLAEVERGSGASNDTNLGGIVTDPTTVRIGNAGTGSGDNYIYSVKIYDSFAGAPSSGF